jgi:hypothetical protein
MVRREAIISDTMPDSELSFDSIETGKLYGPYYYPLADRFERYMEAIENDHEWHTRRSPAGPPVAPPTLLGLIGMRFIEDVAPVPAGTMHVRQEIEIKNSIRSDRQPISYGQFTDKSEKRGRQRFTFEARCRDSTGLILGVSKVTMEDEQGSGNTSTGLRTGKEQGEHGSNELTAISRKLTAERIAAYSEGSASPQPQLMAFDYVGEMMERQLGRAWYEFAGLSMSFLAPVLEGQTLTTGGRLAEEREEGAVIRQTYDVWCDNDAGETVAAGTATALAIPPSD